MEGRFITIEGTDGGGKSTQIEKLVEYLKSIGREVVVTREPGGTNISEKLREILLDAKNSEMTDITEALLYAASRAQHVEEKILPAVKEGKIVICDRFLDSSIVYQGYARGLDIEMIKTINSFALSKIKPDITLFFDIRPEIGILRKKNMHDLDRMEQEKIDFHNKVYNGYKALLNENPERIKRIDAEKTIDEVYRQVIDAVNTIL